MCKNIIYNNSIMNDIGGNFTADRPSFVVRCNSEMFGFKIPTYEILKIYPANTLSTKAYMVTRENIYRHYLAA